MEKINCVVFIDDDELTNSYHQKLAEVTEFAEKVLVFESPETALTYFREIPDKYSFPELIFIDISMPGMSGHKLVEEIQEIPQFNTLRTVISFLTGSLDVKDFIKADEANVELYYWKPLKRKDIEQILDVHFRNPQKNINT